MSLRLPGEHTVREVMYLLLLCRMPSALEKRVHFQALRSSSHFTDSKAIISMLMPSAKKRHSAPYICGHLLHVLLMVTLSASGREAA